jgi:hypothetical protein
MLLTAFTSEKCICPRATPASLIFPVRTNHGSHTSVPTLQPALIDTVSDIVSLLRSRFDTSAPLYDVSQILDPFVVTTQGVGAAGKCCDATGRRFRHFSLGVDLDSRVIIRTCASRSRGIPFDTVPDISKVLSQCAEEMVQTTSARELVATCAGCHVRHAVIPSGTWDLEGSPTVLLLRLRDIESFNAVNVESSVMFGGTKYVLSCALALDPRGVSSCFLRNAVDGTWSGLVSGGVVREYGTWEGVLSIVGGTGARRAMNYRYSPRILCYQAEDSCGHMVQRSMPSALNHFLFCV